MHLRTLLLTLGAVTVLGLSACDGPTKQGVQARSAANERVNVVNAQMSFDQARRAFEVGQFERALREVTNAIERYPDEPRYHLLQGRIYHEMHRLEDAQRAFVRAVEANEEFADAHYFLGIVFQRWSNHQAAYEHYWQAAQHDTSKVQYLLAAAESLITLGEYDRAEDVIRQKLSYFEHNSALRHLLGQVALLQDRPTEAARLLSEARLLNPDDLMLLEEVAWAQYKAAQYGRAYESISHLLRRVEERRTDLLMLKARSLVYTDRLVDARNVYLELSQKNASDVDVWIELGSVASELGDDRRVAISSTRIIALAPERFEGYLLRALYERSKGNTGEVASFIEQAMERADKSILPLLMLGALHEERGEHLAAANAYGQALQLDPNHDIAQSGFKRASALYQMTYVPID